MTVTKAITTLQQTLDELFEAEEATEALQESIEYERAILDGYHMLVSDVDVNSDTAAYIIDHCEDVTAEYQRQADEAAYNDMLDDGLDNDNHDRPLNRFC